MRSVLAAVLTAGLLLGGAGVAVAQPAPGMTLTGIMTSSLDSVHAYVGEDVAVTDVSSSDGRIRDATMQGTVTHVIPAGQGRNAEIGMHFDYLRLANGRTYEISGVIQSMQVNTKSNAAKEAGGALVGMLAGNALGKAVLGISGLGIAGAVGGYLVARNNKANVVIPANSAITVRLVTPRRQAY